MLDIYQKWLVDWDTELRQSHRKILLLQDKFSGHIPPPNLQNIRIENFEPNLTSHVQPLDQGIIRCFKAHYRAAYICHAVDCYDEGITPANIYDIDQLQAMRLADTARNEVDATTIKNCWKKVGILPDTLPAPSQPPTISISALIEGVVCAKNELNEALDQLQSTGVLHQKNRMNIEFLLSCPEENLNIDLATDQDIFEAVMEAWEAEDNLNINGGDDDEEPISSKPLSSDVCKAVTTITDFLIESDDPHAHRLESLLQRLKRDLRLTETRSFKTMHVTDYFYHIQLPSCVVPIGQVI